MAFIQTTPAGTAQGDVHTMYTNQQKAVGYVPNYAKVFSHRPEVMGHWADLLRGIRQNVDRRRFELVTLAAAHALRNSYCSLAHGKVLTEFFSNEEIQALVSDDRPDPLSAAEAAMMNFARKVVRHASQVTAGDVAALREHGFTDAEIFDIAATAAARTFFANLCDSLGTEADVTFMEMDDALRQSLTIGRPIAFGEPERLPAQTSS
jgi:uncharacterized peroxidase-related enzyme